MYTITKITPADATYPASLRALPQPPTTLYLAGNVELLSKPSLAVVGSRNMTNYGKLACEQISTHLVQSGFVLVSGLASGIDAVAHRTTLDYNGYTIAVLANGLLPQYIFPSDHQRLAQRIVAEHGLLVSEYPPAEVARRYYFPARNRIIAGLTLGTVVVEARLKSGALVTAKQALEMNREVFAVPGSIFSSRSVGTNHLIQQGAKLIQQPQDILDELALSYNAPAVLPLRSSVTLTGTDQAITALLESEMLTAEILTARLRISAETVAQHLTGLEIQGIVRRNMDYTYSLSQPL